jgi:flagellar hook-associated protein 2
MSSVGPSTPPLQLGGLASGLDTNTIIQQLMGVERQPQDRLHLKELLETARQQALKDVSKRLGNLMDAVNALQDPTAWADIQTVDSSDVTHLAATRTGGAAAGAYTVSVTKLAGADQYTQSSANTTAGANDTLHLSVGGGTIYDVQIANGDSLATIAGKINGTSSMPVYATVSGGKLVISGKTTGAANTVSITGGVAAGFTFAQSAQAQDASLTVDSGLGPVAITSASNTVTNAIAGVSLTLKGQTANATITVGSPAPDTGAIQGKVQAFVDQYNSTTAFIQGKVTEQVVVNPQSEADREKGVLYNDTGLESLLSSLRTSLGDFVKGRPGTMQALVQAGVSTGAASATLDQDAIHGKLTFDTDAFSTALTNTFADVKSLFTNATGSYSTEGVSQRLHDLLNTYTSATGIMATRDQSEQSQIASLKQQQLDWNDRLTAKEQSLRQMFTNMEVALQQNQLLSSQVSAQLAQLPH